MTTALHAALQKAPDVVLWDLDNTLYLYAPAHEAGMEAAQRCCEARLGLPRKEFIQAFERARLEVKERLSGTAASHSRLLYFQRLIEITTRRDDPALCLELETTYWRRFMGTARLLPGARASIEELRYARIPQVLVTDLTAQIQMRKLVRFELDGVFDLIVTSEEVGADKPDARIFVRALDKAGLSRQSTVWMIGDSAKRDMIGAREAVSAVTFQKLHHGVARCPDADATIEDFTRFADTIRSSLPR